jgi:hypothetical protein
MTPAAGLPLSPAGAPGSRCSINRSWGRERPRGAGTPAAGRSCPSSHRIGRARGSRMPTSHARRRREQTPVPGSATADPRQSAREPGDGAAQNDRHGDSEYAHARAELDHWLHSKGSDVPTDRSDAGLTVAWRQHDRERRRLAATATRGKSSSAPTARSSHSVTSDPMTIGSPLGDPATGPSGS